MIFPHSSRPCCASSQRRPRTGTRDLMDRRWAVTARLQKVLRRKRRSAFLTHPKLTELGVCILRPCFDTTGASSLLTSWSAVTFVTNCCDVGLDGRIATLLSERRILPVRRAMVVRPKMTARPRKAAPPPIEGASCAVAGHSPPRQFSPRWPHRSATLQPTPLPPAPARPATSQQRPAARTGRRTSATPNTLRRLSATRRSRGQTPVN